MMSKSKNQFVVPTEDGGVFENKVIVSILMMSSTKKEEPIKVPLDILVRK